MDEPYFEDHCPDDGPAKNPFHCHLEVFTQNPLLCAAHWHYAIEILYVTLGSATVLLNGNPYILEKEDMILIGSRDVHAIYGGPVTEYICIKFDPEILYFSTRYVFETRYITPFVMGNKSPQKVFPRKEISGTSLPALITEAFQEFMDKKYGYELAVSTNICKIFLWVLRSWNDKGLTVLSRNVLKEKDIHRLQKVFDCFDSQYMNNLTAEDMARQCNMSYSYFSRFFKSTIGKNFSAYLNFVRITEAEKLLLSTDKTITDIAMATGFSSASYFISQFRQIKNISPNHYRQKLELLP